MPHTAAARIGRWTVSTLVAVGVATSGADLASGRTTTATAAAAKAGAKIDKCKGKKKARRACKKQNAARKLAFNQIKDSNFQGYREDGAYEDETFCANGKFRSATTSDGSTGVSTGTTWKVTSVLAKSKTNYSAVIEDDDGSQFAIGRKGSQWQVGYVSFDEATSLGDATKTDAKAACATLDTTSP